jgi:two-component system, OmpR family, sensor histidine kinase TctE
MRRRFKRLTYAFDSLLGEVLLWILILLMFLWAMSVVMTYHVADTIAHRPYDELLTEDVETLVKFVQVSGGKVRLKLPTPVPELLHGDDKDRRYYQVLDPDDELVAGDKDFPPLDSFDRMDIGKVRFRDDQIGDDDVRIAYTFVPVAGGNVLVQVGETLHKRRALVASIVSGVIVPQFVIVPVAVLLVYLALSRGITPLQRLQEELRQRRPTDLSPISLNGIPAEIRPLLAALNDVMVRLEENLMAQRRFIADAAHQLKTPLTGLRMQTELALHESDVGHMRDRLEQAALSAERLSHLTHQLLSLARAEATTESSDAFQTIDLEQLAPEVMREWAERAIAGGIDFGFEGTGRPLPIIGSPFLLHELLNNLIDNAIKYTPRGGQVMVRLIADRAARIEVEDTGAGIPIAERGRVFERFYRLIGSATDGSGLGLSIVREIADLHRATIDIATGSGGLGTRVAVAFPRTDVAPEEARA